MKKTFLAIFLLISVDAYATPPITDIQIDGEILTSKERILSVLPFKIGDPYDQTKLEQGTQLLKKWGIFDVVEAKAKQVQKGMVIKLNLHEALVIGEIDVEGNYPYIKTKIKKRLNLQVGDMLIPEKIEAQKERIKSFYERLGYYNTQVDVKEEPAPAKNTIYVTYHIIKGERLRLGKLELEGVKAFRKGRIFSFIKPMDLYSEKKLKNSINKLVQFYRDRGYLKAHVRVLGKEIDWEKRRVSLKLAISEDPKVDVLFGGKRHYRLPTLKKTITLYRDGNFDSLTLEESSEALIKRLQKDGYKEARVTFKQERISPEHFRVLFNIEPGPYSYVESIHFSGNESIPDKKLKKQLLTQEHSLTQKGILEESLLEEDRKVAKEFYQSKGFPDVTITTPQINLNPKRTKFDIQFQVEEGPLVKIDRLSFQGNQSFPEEKLIKVLENKEGLPLNELSLGKDREQLEIFYANRGHPYVRIEQQVERKENRMTILYKIQEGPLVKIGEILVIGDVLTGVRAIRQAMGIRPGDLYSYQKIIEAQLNLRRLGAFNAVNIETIGLEEKETIVPLKVRVEERQPFVIDLEGQYSTDQQFAGTLKFTNFNSLGWAKQTRLFFTAGKEKDRAELSWFDPRFLGVDIQTTISSWMDYAKKPVETSLQAGGAVAFFRQFHRFGFLTRYELTRNYNIEGRAKDPGSLRDSTLSQITLSGSYDTRNSYSDPTKGFFTLIGTNIFNEIGGFEANFAKLRLALSHYYSPLKRVTLSNTVRFDRIQSIGANASVPGRQLFTLGGDDTLRGFAEDSLGPVDSAGKAAGGRVRAIYNGELHLRLIRSLQAALFYDLGSLTDSFAEIDSNTLRHSVGFGLRYVTPVGPIRADYGIKLDRKTGESFGRFHLTFGYPF